MTSGRLRLLLGLSSVFLGMTAAFPASDLSRAPQQRSLANNSTSDSSLPSPGADAEYYAASGDGEYVQQVSSPNDFASAQASFRSLAKASHASTTSSDGNLTDPTRPSYDYGYSLYNFNGAAVDPPAFAEDLFQCVLNLFELVPRTSEGVWTPVPEGIFDCRNGLALGQLEVDLVDNPIGFDMSYYDLACVIKMLHSRFVSERSRSFEYEVRAQRDGVGEWSPVMKGMWRQDEQPSNNSPVGSPGSGGLDVVR